MKNIKVLVIMIVLGLIFIILGYYQSQKITNKDEKISQVYNMLDETRKKRIKNKSDRSKQVEIKKMIIRASNRRYTAVNKEYYGKRVYVVTFPIIDGTETEFLVLCNFELNEIVGYGVIE